MKNPVRQIQLDEPLPLDQIFRMANRLTLELLLMVIAYAAVMLSMVATLGWTTVIVAGIAAIGIYHARMRFCAANYYGQRTPMPVYWLWPLQSMFVIAALLLIGVVCWCLGLGAALTVTFAMTMLFAAPEVAMLVATIVGAIPGCCFGVILAVAVMGELGKHWLRLV